MIFVLTVPKPLQPLCLNLTQNTANFGQLETICTKTPRAGYCLKNYEPSTKISTLEVILIPNVYFI